MSMILVVCCQSSNKEKSCECRWIVQHAVTEHLQAKYSAKPNEDWWNISRMMLLVKG